MTEETREAKNIVLRIKDMLFNIDATIVWANGEIKIRQNLMNCYKGSTRKSYQRKFLNAKIDKERFDVLIAELENTKNEILDNLEIILDKYHPRYKQVFMLYFFKDNTLQEIADATNYSIGSVKRMIVRIKDELLDMFI